jgi:hypothetical protein
MRAAFDLGATSEIVLWAEWRPNLLSLLVDTTPNGVPTYLSIFYYIINTHVNLLSTFTLSMARNSHIN